MVHIGDTPCFLDETGSSLLIELVKAQDLQSQDAAERGRFTYLIDVSVTACTKERDNFINANMCSLDQKVTIPTTRDSIWVFVSPACTWI